MSEMPFFKTLYAQAGPVGSFGRGTHYSVLRAPIWQDTWLNPMPNGAMLDFAIIWDEDHDERVLEVIEWLYFAGLLAPVRFIGERKGTLSILIDASTVSRWRPAELKKYREQVNKISNDQCDPWPAYVNSVASLANSPAGTIILDPSIIHEDRGKVATYLQCIDMLWHLGIKQHALQVEVPDPEYEAHLERYKSIEAYGSLNGSQSEGISF